MYRDDYYKKGVVPSEPPWKVCIEDQHLVMPRCIKVHFVKHLLLFVRFVGRCKSRLLFLNLQGQMVLNAPPTPLVVYRVKNGSYRVIK